MTRIASNPAHWDLLAKAADKIKPTDFDEYFELRRLNQQPSDRQEFQARFANYYRLHIGGLTDAFKHRYLHLLVTWQPRGQRDPYSPLLLDLYQFPRRRGDQTLQVSFVSKLVAFHDESRPLFDRHVSRFFGVSVPAVGSVEFRISGFVANLEGIRAQYEAWAASSRFKSLVRPLFQKNPNLKNCHPTRLCDFLVWTVGSYELS